MTAARALRSATPPSSTPLAGQPAELQRSASTGPPPKVANAGSACGRDRQNLTGRQPPDAAIQSTGRRRPGRRGRLRKRRRTRASSASPATPSQESDNPDDGQRGDWPEVVVYAHVARRRVPGRASQSSTSVTPRRARARRIGDPARRPDHRHRRRLRRREAPHVRRQPAKPGAPLAVAGYASDDAGQRLGGHHHRRPAGDRDRPRRHRRHRHGRTSSAVRRRSRVRSPFRRPRRSTRSAPSPTPSPGADTAGPCPAGGPPATAAPTAKVAPVSALSSSVDSVALDASISTNATRSTSSDRSPQRANGRRRAAGDLHQRHHGHADREAHAVRRVQVTRLPPCPRRRRTPWPRSRWSRSTARPSALRLTLTFR